MLIKSKKEMPSTWKADAEALIALLSIKIAEYRKRDPNKVCHELNYNYLRKRIPKNPKNYGPTLLQRTIINKEGY